MSTYLIIPAIDNLFFDSLYDTFVILVKKLVKFIGIFDKLFDTKSKVILFEML